MKLGTLKPGCIAAVQVQKTASFKKLDFFFLFLLPPLFFLFIEVKNISVPGTCILPDTGGASPFEELATRTMRRREKKKANSKAKSPNAHKIPLHFPCQLSLSWSSSAALF